MLYYLNLNKYLSRYFMRIVLLGPSGSGKGTQIIFIESFFGIPKISIGDILRNLTQVDSLMGEQVRTTINSGGFATDSTILKLVVERLKSKDCESGYILDGVPRNINQAKLLLELGVNISHIISIVVSSDVILRLLIGRRIHESSGRMYHVEYSPPIVSGYDDLTSEPLIQRKDYTLDVIRKRLIMYYSQTEPLFTWYNYNRLKLSVNFEFVKGEQDISEISNNITRILLNTYK